MQLHVALRRDDIVFKSYIKEVLRDFSKGQICASPLVFNVHRFVLSMVFVL